MARHITLQGGRIPTPFSSAKTLVFDFDPSQALFEKEGEDLVIQPTQGTPTVIEGFFSSANAGSEAEFILTDGTVLSAKGFFQVHSPSLITALGFSSTPSSGGGGAYDDAAGALIGGVDKLGANGAGDDAPASRTLLDAPAARTSGLSDAATPFADLPAPVAPDAPIDPVAPVDPVGPQPPTDPDCRFVLYGNAADPTSWDSGITAVPPANGNTAGIVSVGNGAYGTAQLLPDGSIKYVPAPGAADWPEDGGPLVDHLLLTLGDGSMRLVEVLLVDGAGYDAAGHADLGGERHEGLLDGVYTVTATAHDDVFARHTGSVGLASGSFLDLGAGDDTLLIQATGVSGGAAYGTVNSTVRMGEGDDCANISVSATGGNAYSVSGGLLDLGNGNDVLDLSALATGYNASAYALAGGAKADLGSGDNAATITSNSQSRYAYGIYGDTGVARSSLVAGDGNDSLTINIQAGSVGAAITNSSVNLGNGDNLITLNVRGLGGNTSSLYGLERGDITTGSGNDTLAVSMKGGAGIYSGTVNMGGGNNLISITGADSALLGTVVMGSGNDSILIDDAGSSASTSKYGIFGYSNVNMGAGNDLVQINLSGNSAEALRTGTLDMGAGNDTVSFQVTGTSYSAGGLNDSAKLYMGAGDDLLTISATVRGSGSLASGMHNNSLVDLGDGNDTMRLYATANSSGAGVYAYGTASSKIAAGNGNDDVLLRATASTSAAKGTAEADGVTSSTIDMGAGNDILTIEASASGAGATARGIHTLYSQGYTVDAGAGDDYIHLSATAVGTLSSLAVGVSNATLLAGTGDDTLDVSILASGGNAVAMGLQQAIVNLGDGNDAAHFDVRSDGDAYGLSNGTNGNKVTGPSVLDLGGGNDTLIIDVHAGHNAYGVHNSTISAGTGDDYVIITTDGAAGSWGLYGSKVDMGAGDDFLSIKAGASGLGLAMENSTADLGAGNDTLEVSGTIHNSIILAGAGNDALRIDGDMGGLSLLDAGADNDLIILGPHFSMDGQATITGGTGVDVLKLDAGLSVFDFSAHTGQITGLERLDLTDGAHEVTLGLDDILALTDDASGAGQGESLRIRGDADDLVHLNGADWVIDTDNTVSLTELDGSSHDYYTAVNGATTVYIDEQIRLDLLGITG